MPRAEASVRPRSGRPLSAQPAKRAPSEPGPTFRKLTATSARSLRRLDPAYGIVAHTVSMWWRFLKAVKSREHRVAPTTWVVAIAAVVYTFAPIDLIPELVLGPLGFADDIGVWSVFAVLFAREQRRWRAGLRAA